MEPPFSAGYPHLTVPRRRPFAWVTACLVATTVGVFVLQLIELHRFHNDVIGDALGFSRLALEEHRYWTVLSYAWVHAVAMFGDSRYFWLHIVANMIPLICLGPALEEILGHARYLALYLGGAVASAVVWLYFSAGADDATIIGASGAVFAIIAGIGVAEPRARVTVFLLVLPLRMSLSVLALLICGIELAQIIFQYIPTLAPYSVPEVAHSAHLGGAAFGAFFTWLVLPKEHPRVLAR